MAKPGGKVEKRHAFAEYIKLKNKFGPEAITVAYNRLVDLSAKIESDTEQNEGYYPLSAILEIASECGYVDGEDPVYSAAVRCAILEKII
jgi:hypothetical protein